MPVRLLLPGLLRLLSAPGSEYVLPVILTRWLHGLAATVGRLISIPLSSTLTRRKTTAAHLMREVKVLSGRPSRITTVCSSRGGAPVPSTTLTLVRATMGAATATYSRTPGDRSTAGSFAP